MNWKACRVLRPLAVLFLATSAIAQSAPPGAVSTRPAFEVISIRPSKPGANQMFMWATSPDGYRVSGQPLLYAILYAYFPQGMAYWSTDRVSRAPAWLRSDLYDIDAKVGAADLAEWQKEGPTPQTPLEKKLLFQQMLQQMLAERLHMKAHLIGGPPLQGLSLEVGKRGPHLTESKPDEVLPAGMRLGDGGVEVPYGRGDRPHFSFYGATMADVAQFLSLTSGGHPVQDHTGLTGKYDFVANWIDDPDSKVPAGAISSDDPDPLSHWDFESSGLRLTPVKIPAQTLVIDHIEKPSEN